ncbi:gephyrin-like [Nilaparvata lugens]|uniref:gephyrin-like n=1 Tax=Nilaparvata lugens TaxID=108931 RepID=UPI00193E2500|nr:gephyrin-like [Nilaparvata lugens]
MNEITVGILTISDSCFEGTAVDSSGPNLTTLIRTMQSSSLKIEAVYNRCVPDDRHKIEDMIEYWADELDVDLIITTGGTGFGPRDVTPEATRTVIEREAHGLTHLMLAESVKITPFASLYRGICGIRGQTLIINTPGSKKASAEFVQAVIKCIPHALAVIKNIDVTVKKDHQVIQNESHQGSCPHSHSKVDISKVAHRQRNHQHLYPMIDYEVALNLVLENCISTESESIDLS